MQKIIPTESRQFKLKLPTFYLIVRVCSCFLAIAVLFFLLKGLFFIENGIEPGAIIPILFIFSLFGGLGFFIVLYAINHYLVFDETEIEVSSLYGKINKIKWSEIKTIKFNPISGYITITNNLGIKIRAHFHLKSLIEFLNTMERKTSWTIKELNLPLN